MKKSLKIFLIVIAVLVGIRLAMEPFVKYYVNKSLSDMEGYTGSIRDVDIHLIRGAYKVEGIKIEQVKDSIATPFVTIDTLDLSVQWEALFDGSIVGEVLMVHPVVNFVSEKEGEEEQTGEETDWVAQLEELMPLTINRFEIKDGTIQFLDPSVSPEIDVHMRNLFLVANNLSNVRDSVEDMPGSITASATTVGGGELDLEMEIDILNQIPEFNAQLKLMSVDLTQLNDFIMAYGNFDVKEGMFSVISEIEVNNGQVSGYIKPFFENLNVFSLEQENQQKEGFFRKAWEAIVGLGAEIFENQPRDRVATEVPIEGTVDSPDANVPVTVFNIFRNAFVDAINKEFGRSTEEAEV